MKAEKCLLHYNQEMYPNFKQEALKSVLLEVSAFCLSIVRLKHNVMCFSCVSLSLSLFLSMIPQKANVAPRARLSLV